MPEISLVVCVRDEDHLLARLLEHAAGCYDDLVIVNDGANHDNGIEPPVGAPLKEMAFDYEALPTQALVPRFYKKSSPHNSESVKVLQHGGRYFEGPRCYQQEPHWPFAWWQARHDWILRLDADEFPSEELKVWLRQFRGLSEPAGEVSGYTCVWPLWNGTKTVTTRWPAGRIFLFHRRRVRFFGMVEQVPVPDKPWESLDLVLHHQPKRKSYGVRNILLRRQAYLWRRVIAQSLMKKPTALPHWRWTPDAWPAHWDFARNHPLQYSVTNLFRLPLGQLKGMLKANEFPSISACLNPGLHHFMLGLRVFLEKRRFRKDQ